MAYFINSFPRPRRVCEFPSISPGMWDLSCDGYLKVRTIDLSFSRLMFFKIKDHITWSLKNYG